MLRTNPTILDRSVGNSETIQLLPEGAAIPLVTTRCCTKICRLASVEGSTFKATQKPAAQDVAGIGRVPSVVGEPWRPDSSGIRELCGGDSDACPLASIPTRTLRSLSVL